MLLHPFALSSPQPGVSLLQAIYLQHNSGLPDRLLKPERPHSAAVMAHITGRINGLQAHDGCTAIPDGVYLATRVGKAQLRGVTTPLNSFKETAVG